MVSLASSLPIISKPLDDNPDHLTWETFITIDTHDKTRKIPKSIFITPNLNESKGNCAPDYKLGPDGRCYKTLQIDPLLMLKKQIESLLKNNRTATTEYEDDYDYSEYGESTESMNSNGQYTVPLSLGFGSDNRIPQQQQTQQTTFPNLNRVVKDDSHVSPVVPTTTTAATTDNREVNQPFRASTTGIDLGSEDVIVKPKHETKSTASVAATSSIAPSSTTAYSVEPVVSQSSSTSKNPSSRQTFEQNSNPSESSMATITIESLIEDSESITEVLSTTRATPSTESTDTVTESSSPSVRNFSIEDDNASSTEQIETTTSSVDISASENPENNTEAAVSPLTPTVENIEAPETVTMPSSTESQELTRSSPTELTGQSSNVESISTEATSTKMSVEHVQTLSHLHVPVLPAADFIAKNQTQPIIGQDTDNAESAEWKQTQTGTIVDEADHKSTIEPSVKEIKSMNLKLTHETSTQQAEIKVVTESKISTVSVPSQKSTEQSSTTSDDGLRNDKNDSFEMIDAYFIPSQSETSPEEIDPAVGKNVNVSRAEPRYRLENASVIPDEELPEAELAPVIDTGIDGHSNIELVKPSDGSPHEKFEDEKKNLSARLAEELLFQGPSVEFKDRDNLPSKPVREFNVRVVKSESAMVNGKTVDLEEVLSGIPVVGSGLGSDSTTEEPIDYDSKEIKIQTDNISPEISRNIDYEGPLPVKEAVPFNREAAPFNPEQHFFQAPPPPPSVQQPSIYSTFISRLKVAPPFVELHDQHPETIQYSHTPFDITSTFQNTSPDRRFGVASSSVPVTTHSSFTLPSDADRSFEVEQPPSNVRSKSLQIGINCYVKNLDKQQYIICDDA